MYLCAGMYTCIQVPSGVRDIGCPVAGVTGSCEPLDLGAGK